MSGGPEKAREIERRPGGRQRNWKDAPRRPKCGEYPKKTPQKKKGSPEKAREIGRMPREGPKSEKRPREGQKVERRPREGHKK